MNPAKPVGIISLAAVKGGMPSPSSIIALLCYSAPRSGSRTRCHVPSDENAFYLIKRDLLSAAVVQVRRVPGFAIGYLLGNPELAAVAEVLGDRGRPEAMLLLTSPS